MIKLTRVDHRLIHGQVAFSWTKYLQANCILIASDNLMKDSLKMAAMKMAVPSGVKLVMKSIDDSAKALNSGVTDKYKLFVLCESITDVHRLVNKTDQIKKVNLGGMKNGDDRQQISKAVHVSQDDIDLIKEMCNSGIEVNVQLVPDDPEYDVLKLL